MEKFKNQSNWSKGGSIGVCLFLCALFAYALSPHSLIMGSVIYDVVFIPTIVIDYMGLSEIVPVGPFGFFAFFFITGLSYLAGALVGLLYGKIISRK
ncbi:MAG: hypothetical protein KBD47_01910 [Candidatus Pacebacteria bacterium]|jgi:hypothetical protein|nr:hypothetical protein [Candidatus Paceibacterota bacterium]